MNTHIRFIICTCCD